MVPASNSCSDNTRPTKAHIGERFYRVWVVVNAGKDKAPALRGKRSFLFKKLGVVRFDLSQMLQNFGFKFLCVAEPAEARNAIQRFV